MTTFKPKPIFFTSDWHLFHKKAIEFDERPFKNIEHMHRVLVNNFNSTVPHTGLTYFLGDMGFSKTGDLSSIISQLNGTKVLVIGNHDKGTNVMFRAGFDVVVNSASLIVANQLVTMSHCPLQGVFREDISKMERVRKEDVNWHGESRHSKRYSLPDWGQFHLHGHIHASEKKEKLGVSKKILDRQFDVGVVANNYRPVSISVIESWVATYGK